MCVCVCVYTRMRRNHVLWYSNNDPIYSMMDAAIKGIAQAEGGKLRHFVILPSVYLDLMAEDTSAPPALHRDILPLYKRHPLLNEDIYAIDVAVSYTNVIHQKDCLSRILRLRMDRHYDSVQAWGHRI